MTIPSGKGRNGDLSIAIILLKSGSTFLTSFLGVYHRAAIKAGSRHCSPNVRKSLGRLLREAGWSRQQPIERATQRNEEAIKQWSEERWPEIKKKPSRTKLPSSG